MQVPRLPFVILGILLQIQHGRGERVYSCDDNFRCPHSRTPPCTYTHVKRYCPIKCATNCAAPKTCGENSPVASAAAPRIVGGEDAVAVWPWQCSMRIIRDGAEFICGAVIIDENWVLTATHCVDSTHHSDLTIYFGSSFFYGSEYFTGEFRTVTSCTQASNYDGTTLENDIAWCRLSSAIIFSETIGKICLGSYDDVIPGSFVTVTGFGINEYVMVNNEATGVLAARLQQVTFNVKDMETCINHWGDAFDATKQFCAGIGAKDSCGGDSGGPLQRFINGAWRLLGITSYGSDHCGIGLPGVYTNVGYYIPEINQTCGCL